MTVVLVAKLLWVDNGKFELVMVTLGTVLGAVMTGVAVA